MNLEGRLIGNRYEILEQIGSGGMATVYKARCHVLNRNVAVKVLREEFTTDSEFIKRFNVEAQAAASLTHPNIVSIYDVGSEDDLHYIVMELIQGQTLKEIINENGVLPWKWSVNISIQIASALEMAHRNNIVHRDIKPHNIIINEDGIAKVTDFGIAKAVSNSTITAFGTTIGSVHYFSPEHARGGYTDAKSDIYSLGVVMYEMMTGKVPFDADTPVSIALKHMQEEAVNPREINPTIPESVSKIIMKAMQKEPNLRYSSATEMLRDLREALKDPNGDFVKINRMSEDAPTQRIDLNETQKEDGKGKKKGKFRQYLSEHKGVRILLILLACLVIFLSVMGITAFVVNKNRPNQIQIPSLVGTNIDEAKKQLDELKLKYEITEEYNAEKEAGVILSQEPKYQDNYKINDTETIKLVVSKGQELTTVPKIIGKTQDEAQQALTDSKLVAEVIEEKSEKVEQGVVIRQEPAANTQVNANSSVKIYVSIGRGIKEVTVPYVIGKTQEEAKKLLEDAGLTLGTVKTETDTTKSNGVVLKQSVDADKTVDEKTPVSITVNQLQEIKNGKVNINLKSVVGYTPKKDENGNTVTPNNVEVVVKVTSNGTEDTIYKKKHPENTESITVDVQGIGTVTVKVFVDGVRKTQDQLDLNSSNPVLNVD